MSAFELILHGMADVVTNPLTLLYLLAGTFGGIIFGAIPGLTGALGVSLMLPFTFSMPPTQGIAMLIGIYVGGVSGGLIASIMLNIPGNAAAIVTCFDGAPMARNGHPYRALSYGATARPMIPYAKYSQEPNIKPNRASFVATRIITIPLKMPPIRLAVAP